MLNWYWKYIIVPSSSIVFTIAVSWLLINIGEFKPIQVVGNRNQNAVDFYFHIQRNEYWMTFAIMSCENFFNMLNDSISFRQLNELQKGTGGTPNDINQLVILLYFILYICTPQHGIYLWIFAFFQNQIVEMLLLDYWSLKAELHLGYGFLCKFLIQFIYVILSGSYVVHQYT